MWWLVIALVAVLVLITVVVNRRGSTGQSRADDLATDYHADGQRNEGGYAAPTGCEPGPTNLPVTEPQVRALRTVQSMGWP